GAVRFRRLENVLMKQSKQLLAIALPAFACCFFAANAPAQSINLGSGGGFVIDGSDPDNDGVGVFLSTFDVAPGSPQDVVTESQTVTLNDLNHTFLGDLQAFLVFDPLTPNDDTDDIFQSLFVSIAPGNEFAGDASDFGGTYTFDDDSTNSLWNAAAALDGNQVVPGGTYFPASRIEGDPNLEDPVSLDLAFGGRSTAGTWAIVMFDLLPPVDFGSLGGFTVDVTPVPESASLGLLCIGAGLLKRRRG
ncbi:MAG: PEP-CTERM sorting domain-containing protein, partial [Planctomycetota bacterium]